MGRQPRPRLTLDIAEIPTYAIGDIHGRYDLLLKAEEAILQDGARLPGQKLIVTLGDYIDRGLESAQVIAHLMEPPPDGFDRICLAGNHEIAMLDYVDGWLPYDDWMRMGSAESLKSYGLDPEHLPLVFPSGVQLDAFLRQSLPHTHLDFMRALPIMLDTPSVVFVHAGIDPMLPLSAQTDEDLVLIRHRFLESRVPLPKLVVHGHTPSDEPDIRPRRLNLDTRAFRSGRLTVARFWQGRVHLFST
ncbi:serine/threonine protein phosphatase [Rhizobium bangladeshense]|nr:serine/threonine protein phosphatase [Rhizobium bangladeshense]MBX5218178.1 serine/threonine protein phosphatase [Rhizobium sp. NLR9a]MBX5218836.1 serine/threonine protein phosphatase [Rhizobium sp. NLR8a]MBX5235902.1 serine/threonine protein phosphatase [Rhizobium sp. NLR4a]MBX5241389.1 serine/threonine protein phosphatase [Rhizobium sp. NLR22b]MBX5248215.1 serine/threonine protein phosphatase [Rhizobium sp. NLR3b]MBX5253113.1 serine/threonine protein phosphatase [Rhizobium sp. NLR4b]MBX